MSNRLSSRICAAEVRTQARSRALSTREKVLLDVARLSGSALIVRLIMIVRGLIVPRFLGPASYGVLSGLGVISLYNAQSNLGIIHGMNKEISHNRGRGNYAALDDVKNNALTSILITSMLVSVALLIISFLKSDELSPLVVAGIRAYAIITLMEQLQMFYHSVLRAEHRFEPISKSLIIFSATSLAVIVLLIRPYHLYGVLVSLIASHIVTNAYLIKRSRHVIKLRLQKGWVLHLIKRGLPISVVMLVHTAFTTLDRIMILKFLDVTALGFYGLGLTFSGFLMYIPGIIGQVMYPRFIEQYGETESVPALKESLLTSVTTVAYTMPFLIGFVFVTVPALVLYLFPEFESALPTMLVLVIVTFFISIPPVCTRFLIAIDRERRLVIFQTAVIALGVALNYVAIRLGLGVVGIAMATGIAYFILSGGMILYILNLLHARASAVIRSVLGMLLPFFLVSAQLLLFSLVDFFRVSRAAPLSHNISVIGLQLMILGVSSLPVLLKLNKETGVIQVAWNALGRRSGRTEVLGLNSQG